MAPDYQAPFSLPEDATQVVLARHGSTVRPQSHIPFELVGGQRDSPLTPDGHAQARALGDRLRTERIASLFITPLQRTAQTAAPLAAQLSIDPVVVPELREVHLGAWELDGGLLGWGVDRDAMRRRVLEAESWGIIPEAESMDTFAARVRLGLDRVADAIGPGRMGVAFVHGGVIAELCHQITASRPFAFLATENGSITRVIRPARGRWFLLTYNDTSHLAAVA
jgi:probable phosphoglycerate mutase